MKHQIILILLFLSSAVLSLAVFAKGNKLSTVRYVPVRVGHGFSIYDLQTKLWLQRQVQLRVSALRKLPDPLMTSEHGTLMHCTDFDPGGCGTGNLSPNRFVVKDGYRVWQWKNHINKDDLKGNRRFGVTLDRPNSEGKFTKEPMELFEFPEIHDQEPNQWSEWEKHSSQRHGDFGWWSEVHNEKSDLSTPIPYPFEMRWRLLLTDNPGRVIDDETIEVE
ncbi:MAG: hypothetical protein K2X93_00390 [Candidatus Obscuribacterales bacterium]|nr:hypothetical protein [Candidatus Obscuribacterales bacterium]